MGKWWKMMSSTTSKNQNLFFFLNSYRQTHIPDILGDVLWDQNLCEGHSEYLECQVSAILQRNYATVYISGATFWNCKVAYFNLFRPLCTLFLPLYGFLRHFFLLFAKEVDVFVAVFFKKGIDTCHCPKVATMNHFGLPGIWVWIKSLAL